MEDLPHILVVSSSNTKPKSLIKLMTKQDPVEVDSGLVKLTWKIDTKYYTANVEIVAIPNHEQIELVANATCEALIVHMDSNKSSGLEDLKQWEKLDKDFTPEVKLLLANYCNETTKVTRNDANLWCLNRGFELIELFPSSSIEQNIPTEEDIITEKFGIERIIEALEAHTWSNLVMKPKGNKPNSIPQSNIPSELSGEDDFTELFSHLCMMKDSLQTLPMAQRKQCAEQMVTAFWKAIGGDEDELSDL